MQFKRFKIRALQLLLATCSYRQSRKYWFSLCHTTIAIFLFFFSWYPVICSAKATPPFQVEGALDWKVYPPNHTNFSVSCEGKFAFAYSNDVWHIQFTYEDCYNANPSVRFPKGQMLDCRNIPDGIRNIIIPAVALHEIGSNKSPTEAFVLPDKAPPRTQMELLLPWLTFCPENQDVIQNSTFVINTNEGKLELEQLQPEEAFLSRLTITNNGTLRTADGRVTKWPKKAYQDGFINFLYAVSETTNCSGTTFPVKATLSQFMPCKPYETKQDTWPAIVAELVVNKLVVNDSEELLTDIPHELVALDGRPNGLHNGVTVNYGVSNEQWPSITNKLIMRLADVARKRTVNNINDVNHYSRHRIILLSIMTLITTAAIVALILDRKYKHKHKQTP